MHMIRWLKRGAFVLLILVVLAFGTGWWLLRGSLATLDGTVMLPDLSAPVTIDRDALGVVTIHATNEIDAMRALGYVHAQERFFEMDLLRRSAAGELSELFGKIALETDKKHRVHRLRARALNQLLVIAGDKLPQLRAYTDGINAGLADLKVRPWPYLLLQSRPEPWRLEDTALAGYAMFFDLQGGTNQRELALWRIKQVIPPALYKLIGADGTEWDAPLEGGPRGNVALPDAAMLDLSKLPAPGIDGSPPYVEPNKPGSNNFAIAGALTKDGRAIVADDMHLGLRAPNIWFRARLLYADPKAPDGKVDVGGFTLPGVPGVIVGSNTHVAWAFTNSYGDWMDWVRDCDDVHDFACVHDTTPEQTFVETIHVKGGSSLLLKVVQRREGTRMPDVAGATAKLSLVWTAHFPGALTLGSMDMTTAENLDAAVRVMNHAGIPAQNMLVADSSGHIAWTIAGRIPVDFVHTDCDRKEPINKFPTPYADKVLPWMNLSQSSQDLRCIPWAGNVPNWGGDYTNWTEHNPVIINPASNRLWSANNRVTDGANLATIGDSGYALGARAKQIRDDLFAKNQFTEKDMLAIQLDDRALFLERWWKQLRTLVQSSDDLVLKRMEAATRYWNAHASGDAVTYRIVRAWRLAVLDRIGQGLMAPAQVALGKDFVMPGLEQLEGVAWVLVTQRPTNLLPRKFGSWDALLIDAAHQTDSDLAKFGPLDQRRWGERNTAAICHPLAGALPSFLKHFLCMPPDELPGDSNMPRVAAPDFGASERMLVSPGHEADGIIEMPGGQSGNPLSPFWGAGHAAWVHGEPTPFLPGPTTHTLRLLPGR
jgi:penicillin amidase